MSQKFFLMICFIALTRHGSSQVLTRFLDSTERSFDRIKNLATALSCDLEFDRKVDSFGRPFYINGSGTRVDISFYNVKSLPFYNNFQTDFSTTQSYPNWIKYINPNFSEQELSLVTENKDSSYIILRLCEKEIETLRIISRLKTVFYSISMISTEIPFEKQLWYLKFYLKTNKRVHNETNFLNKHSSE